MAKPNDEAPEDKLMFLDLARGPDRLALFTAYLEMARLQGKLDAIQEFRTEFCKPTLSVVK